MEEHANADDKKRQVSEAPPDSAINIGVVDAKGDSQKPNHNRKKRKPLTVFECWTIGLAIAGIGVGAFTGGAIYWQAKIGAKGLALQQSELDLNRDVTQMSYGVRLTVQMVVYRLRPEPESWVAVQFHTVPDRPDRVAENIVLNATLEFRSPNSIPPIGDIPRVRQDVNKAPCLRPNQEACVIDIKRALPMPEYDAYMAGTKNLYVWGHVTYYDNVGLETFDFCQYTSVDKVGVATPEHPSSYKNFMQCR